MVAVAGIVMLVTARIAFQTGDVTYFTADKGLLFASPDLWISDRWLTMVVNTALLLGTALVWLLTIEIFNPFRSMSTLPASLFLIMPAALPDLTAQLYGGTLLAAVMPGCLALLWSTFADTGRLRHIFLLFAVLSGLSMTQYCFAVYIPAFVIGCVQMKIFSLRTVMACVLGLITPWWIVLGSGLATPADIHLPSPDDFFASFRSEGGVHLLTVGILTAVLFVVSWLANVMKVLTLNANLRAFNGSLALVGIFSIVAMCVDFANAAAYLPTLMLATAYELGYTFGSTGGNPRRFISVVSIMLLYVAIFVLRLL